MYMMASRAELSEQNFRRISWINILLTPLLFILFAWPYLVVGINFNIAEELLYIGTFCFSFSFTLTILHGHVTMALGALHRSHYHDWLDRHHWSYGLLMRPIFFSTRFRLILLILSFVLLAAGVMLHSLSGVII